MTRWPKPIKRHAIPFIILLTVALSLRAQDGGDFVIPSPDHTWTSPPIDAVVYSPDGTRIAAGGRDNIARLLDASTGELQGLLVGHTAWVTQVAFSPDGTVLVSGSRDGTVRLWDTHRYVQLNLFTHHTGPVTGVAFSPDGLLLASGSADGTVWIGVAATGDEIATLINYSGPVWSVAFSPDGGSLVAGSEDGTIWWWGLYDSSVTRLARHTGPVTALAFSADRTYLGSSSWDGTIRLWDTVTGNLLTTLTGHQGPVTDMAFDADGSQLVSASLDGRLRLWEVETGRPRAVLQGGCPLTGVALDAERGQAVAAGIYGALEIWDVGGRAETLIQTQPTRPAIPTVVVQAPTLAPPTRVPAEATPVPPPVTALAQPTLHPTQPPPPHVPTISAPTVNIFAAITTFPLDGVSWAIDPWERNVGHFQGTAWVGANGNIALGGHSLYPDGSRGVFNGLYGLNLGDPIILTVDGMEWRFVVAEKITVSANDLSVVYPTATPQLTLITCDIPTWNPATNSYEGRLVVIAVPA